jgi:hypothetical protein
MPVTYVIEQGDCLSSIAEKTGFLPETIWNTNPDLKQIRNNPNALLPGDQLIIPDRNLKEYDRSTDQRHTFVRKGVPARFRLIVERYQKPVAKKRYILTVDGKNYEGTTSETGLIEIDIHGGENGGLLRIPDEQIECELNFGQLDPLEEISGAQARLQNLGYYQGDITGETKEDFREALELFQSDQDVTVTGELDDNTIQKLLARHDKEHQTPSAAEPPPEDGEASSDDQVEDEGDVNEEEDELAFQQLESAEE